MSKFKIINNVEGFSLVEVLISTGLAVGLSLVIIQLMQQGNRVTKTTQIGFDTFDFHAMLKDTLTDRASCTRTFGKVMKPGTTPELLRNGFAPGAANILDTNGVYNGDGNVVWKKDDIVIDGLKLKSLTIPSQKMDLTSNTLVKNFTPINSTLNKGFVEIHAKLEQTGSHKNSYGSKDKLIKLYLTTEVYNAAANDYRLKECQLSGAGHLTTFGMIVCSKSNSFAFSGEGVYAFAFAAADCEGGALPDADYLGIPISISSCHDEYNASVVNPGVVIPTAFQGNITGPGFSFLTTEPCEGTDTTYQAGASVIFVKK